MAEATTGQDAPPEDHAAARPAGHDDAIGPSATAALLAAVTALGALARFYRLGAQPLWMDETFTLNAALLAMAEGPLAVARLDHCAPAAYWMAWLSVGIGGPSAFWLRLPMALAGTLTVPLMYALGRRLLGSAPVGLAAAAVTAASPFAIWYAQEGRMYAPMILASAAYIFACWPAASGRPGPRGWAAMAAATAVGLYVHHYLALLSATFGLYLLGRLGPWDRRAWVWAGTQLAGALAFVPWLALSAEHLGNSAGTDKPLMILWMPYTAFTFVGGFSLGPTARELRLDGVSAALRANAGAIALVGASTLLAGLAGLRRIRREAGRPALAWCLAWAVGPMALAVAATLVTDISYNARYAASCFPAVALILGAALASARRSTAAALGVAGLAAATAWSLWNWYESPRYAKEDLRAAASQLAAAFEPGDLFVLANDRAVPTLLHYGFPCPPGALVARDPASLADAAGAIDRLAGGGGPSRRAWLLEYREWEADPRRVLRSALDASAEPMAERRWPGVTLRLYRIDGGGGDGAPPPSGPGPVGRRSS